MDRERKIKGKQGRGESEGGKRATGNSGGVLNSMYSEKQIQEGR